MAIEPRHLDVAYRLTGAGRTGTTGEDDHVRDMIFNVLFTSPGERVNRPDFGCGLKTLVFAPASQAVAEGQQRASSAVPMDATLVAELQQQGVALHELVGGAAPSLTVPAVESRPDPSGS